MHFLQKSAVSGQQSADGDVQTVWWTFVLEWREPNWPTNQYTWEKWLLLSSIRVAPCYFKALGVQFLGDEKYSNTRIFDRRKSEYSNSGSQCQLSPLMVCDGFFSTPYQVCITPKSAAAVFGICVYRISHHVTYRKVADKSWAYKHISRFLHQASMQTRLQCKPCLYAPLIFWPGLYAHRPIRACIDARVLRTTRVDLPLTTGMAAVLLCTVHSACTPDLPDPHLHRSQASTRDGLICIWPVWFSGFYPRCACMQTRLLSTTLRYLYTLLGPWMIQVESW